MKKEKSGWTDSGERKVEKNEKKLFYFKELVHIDSYENPSEELKQTLKQFEELKEKASELGILICEESLSRELLEAIPSVYTCISCAEATSNLSNLTGIIFGPQEDSSDVFEMIKEHRTKGFSPLIKRRLVIGSYVLQKENQEKYFLNAQIVICTRVRKLNWLLTNSIYILMVI